MKLNRVSDLGNSAYIYTCVNDITRRRDSTSLKSWLLCVQQQGDKNSNYIKIIYAVMHS